MRRLRLTRSGQSFLILTVGIGVVALVTGNNILYLMESLLLSTLVLSGILSERTINPIHFIVRRYPAIAGERAQDQITVSNQSSHAVYCVTLSEWVVKKSTLSQPTLVFIPRLGPHESKTFTSHQSHGARGPHRWKGYLISTSFPFGFAEKLRLVAEPGERLVWPGRGKAAKALDPNLSVEGSRLFGFGQENSEGEVKPYTLMDDSRFIVWSQSLKGIGPLMRVTRAQHQTQEVSIDVRTEPGDEFENKISSAADIFYQNPHEEQNSTLYVITEEGRKTFKGKNMALNQLASLQAQSPAKARYHND